MAIQVATAVAPLGRRILALAVDWLASLAVSSVFFRAADPPVGGLLAGNSLATLAVFAVSTTVLVALLGNTIGHRLLGLRVVRISDLADDGARSPRPPGLGRGALRTLLLCLVIPAVVWDQDGRGLHDIAAGTVIVRR